MTEENAMSILSVLAEIWEREHNQKIQSLVIERIEREKGNEAWRSDQVQ